MQFAASGFADVSLGSLLSDPGVSDAQYLSPIVTELDGVDIRNVVLMNTLKIVDTLGQPVTANMKLLNATGIQTGNVIRIKYFEQVIFAGTIDHVNQESPDLRTVFYPVDCLDWSQILVRRKLRRNFVNATVQAILQSLLDNELAGEGLTMGTIDARSVIPLVDARDAKMLDVFRQMAAATGQSFVMGFDKSLQMLSTTSPVAPLILNEANTLLNGTTLKTDRETYRNRQYVRVTGTPVAGEDALTTLQVRSNDGQIAARALLEGGTGIYEEIEEVTHPTSNDGAQIALLGIGYANLRLATSGQTRQTFQCQAFGYGFRAGQIATVDLPTFGISGTFVIQQVSISEVDGRYLRHDLELTNSSAQQRAYEFWLSTVQAGKVTVQIPSAVTNNLQTFNTPGADSFIVPADITIIEITSYGGSAGGGGGERVTGLTSLTEKCTSGAYYPGVTNDGCNGGTGGSSGKAVTVLNVSPADTVTLFIGSAGTGGAPNTGAFNTGIGVGASVTFAASDGTDGTASSATYKGTVVCQGNGGQKGLKAVCVETRPAATHYRLCKTVGALGGSGSGIGDAVSVGGGLTGGANGTGNASTATSGHTGLDGLIEIRW